MALHRKFWLWVAVAVEVPGLAVAVAVAALPTPVTPLLHQAPQFELLLVQVALEPETREITQVLWSHKPVLALNLDPSPQPVVVEVPRTI
jgi:hypothetical protein